MSDNQLPKDVQAAILELTDLELLSWLKNGKKDYTEDGREYIRKLNAAEMTVVLKRIQQLGIGAVPVKGRPTGDLADAARSHLKLARPLPVMSEDDDEATRVA